MQDNPELAIRLPRQARRKPEDLHAGSLLWFHDDLDEVFYDQLSGFAVVAFTDLIMTKLYFVESMLYQTFHTRDILDAVNIEIVA